MIELNTVIDTEKIEELYQFDIENKDDLLPELFKIFSETSPKKITEMYQQFHQEDWKSLLRTAHTLKSSAGNLGAIQLSEICRSIEEAAPRNNRDELKPMLAAAEHEAFTAIVELTHWMEEKYGNAA